jgi:outer membrane lipoprotein SlyB
MKRMALAAALGASIALTGCATNPYYGNPYYGSNYPYGYQDNTAARAATGAAVGALGGAAVGAVVPGVSTVQGAVAGAILGGVLGAVVNGRQYYRDTRGYCYYVDQYGQPHYNYNTRC